ncbi:MAG: CrcB family protein [Anaerobacillus sp.]
MEWIMIAIGGSIGAWLRYVISLLIKKWSTLHFPLATFIANILGCFLMGLVYGAGDFGPAISTGVLGALTTFSTFMYETFELSFEKVWLSFLYVILSLICGLFMVATGYMIMV